MNSSMLLEKLNRLPRWKVLLIAGTLSFCLAAWLSMWANGSARDETDLVQPIERTRTDRLQAQAAQGEASAMNTGSPNAVNGSAPLQNPERLSSQVRRNPFGPLNFHAAIEIAQGLTPDQMAKPLPTRKVKQVKAPEPPPPPPPPPPLPPPAPTAPPLPFAAVGSLRSVQITNGQAVAFIKQQDQLLMVRSGDAIGQTYRVESISADKIEFTYLPLMQRQTLALTP